MARNIVTGNRGTTLRRDPRGFTLIELMVVMSIIVVLTTVAIVQYRQSVVLAREAVLKDDLFKMRDAIDQYFADKNQYPGDLADLVSAGYLRALPKDPFTQSDTTWLSVLSDADPTNPAAPTGIYDIKSGADGTAIDGSNYTDW